MGRAKEMMMEHDDWMARYDELQATIDFICPISTCNKKVSEDVDMFQYPDFTIECDNCGEIFNAEWLEDENISANLLQFPDTDVEVDPPSAMNEWNDGDEIFWDIFDTPPENTFDIFSKAQDELLEYIDQVATPDGSHARNRMAFIHCFSIFEAYLSDTYLNLVHQNAETENIFLLSYFYKKTFKNMKISYDELVANRGRSVDEILANKITEQIKKISFHSFKTVNKLFQVYKIEGFDEKSDRDVLFKTLEHRHHCVHRNGCDADGEQLNIFTIEYLKKTLKTMKQVASKINDKVSLYGNPPII